jgi:hypothetical protein
MGSIALFFAGFGLLFMKLGYRWQLSIWINYSTRMRKYHRWLPGSRLSLEWYFGPMEEWDMER